jgi:hypothetical protein
MARRAVRTSGVKAAGGGGSGQAEAEQGGQQAQQQGCCGAVATWLLRPVLVLGWLGGVAAILLALTLSSRELESTVSAFFGLRPARWFGIHPEEKVLYEGDSLFQHIVAVEHLGDISLFIDRFSQFSSREEHRCAPTLSWWSHGLPLSLLLLASVSCTAAADRLISHGAAPAGWQTTSRSCTPPWLRVSLSRRHRGRRRRRRRRRPPLALLLPPCACCCWVRGTGWLRVRCWRTASAWRPSTSWTSTPTSPRSSKKGPTARCRGWSHCE